MARKSRAKRKKKSRNSSGFGLFVLGVIVGTSATLLYQGIISDQPNDIGSGIEGILTAAVERNKGNSVSSTDSLNQSPLTTPQISFDYHEMLLDEETVRPRQPGDDSVSPESRSLPAVPDAEPEELAAAEQPQQPRQPEQPQQTLTDSNVLYVLQVASYKSFQEADRTKANLALQGMEAFIQKVSIEGRGDFYRVRIGPYQQLDVMLSAGERLSKLGYHPLRFKLKSHS